MCRASVGYTVCAHTFTGLCCKKNHDMTDKGFKPYTMCATNFTLDCFEGQYKARNSFKTEEDFKLRTCQVFMLLYCLF